MKTRKEKLLPTIGVTSLGCPKNLVDTENIIGILHAAGYQITGDHSKADLSLVNTCSFIEDSTEESREVLSKLNSQGKKLIITGCMAQRFKENLFNDFTNTKAIVGPGNIMDVLQVVRDVTKNLNNGKKIIKVTQKPEAISNSTTPRLNTQLSPSAYLKISEGCNHRCSFCIIPYLRGDLRSRIIEDILNEAKSLVKSGIKEIILVSQDSTSYGIDIYKKKALSDLLKVLADKSGAKWIRLMYSYPGKLDKKVLDVIKEKENIVKYIDIPLQHASPKILKLMKRPTDVRKTVELIRKKIPDCAIRTTFIVGFPGETEDDFNELYDFVKEMTFDRVGVFTYSNEKECSSFKYKNQVPEEVKKERREKLMLLQQEISLRKNKKLVGKKIEMLVEYIEHLENGNQRVVGRSFRDAPEIDGELYIELKKNMKTPKPGDLIDVRVTSCDEYDLVCGLL